MVCERGPRAGADDHLRGLEKLNQKSRDSRCVHATFKDCVQRRSLGMCIEEAGSRRNDLSKLR